MSPEEPPKNKKNPRPRHKTRTPVRQRRRCAKLLKNGGGINLNASDSANLTNNIIVGRDYGFSVEQVTQLTDTMLKNLTDTILKNFAEIYLKNPKKLDSALRELRRYHERLYEYKELHNNINDILIAFEPFKATMKYTHSRRIVPKLPQLRKSWRPVLTKVDSLLRWAQSIKYIGRPYQELNDKTRSGEDWAIEFKNLRNRINDHIGLNGDSLEGFNYPTKMQIYAFLIVKYEIPWWEKLMEFTSDFGDASLNHMTSIDKKLLKTAEELFELSGRLLSGYEKR